MFNPNGNVTKRDIYRRTMNDPKWQAANWVHRITRNLVAGGYCTRRHGMALKNLHDIDPARWHADTLFVDRTYPALSEAEACREMDERGFVWVDPYFEQGEYFGQGESDRWEPKGWNET